MSEEEFMSRAGRFVIKILTRLCSFRGEQNLLVLRCDDINDVRSRSFSCHNEFSIAENGA